MNAGTDQYFVEYSVRQQAFHVDPAWRCILLNRRAIMAGHELDYVPIGIFPSEEAADHAVKQFGSQLKLSQNVRDGKIFRE